MMWSPEKTEELIQRYYSLTSTDMQIIYFVAQFLRMLLHPNNDKRQKGRPKLDNVCKTVLKKHYYRKVAKKTTENTRLVKNVIKKFTQQDSIDIVSSIQKDRELSEERKSELIGKIRELRE